MILALFILDWLALPEGTRAGMVLVLGIAADLLAWALPLVMAVATLLIAWMTFKVSRESKVVAAQSRDVAERSYQTSQQALEVAYNDWMQVGREAPWSLTKLQADYWLLERLHHDPAVIIATDISPMCSGTSVWFQNPAGAPVRVFRRTDKIVLQIPATNPGSDLILYYREYSPGDEVPAYTNAMFYAGNVWDDEGMRATQGTKQWATPLY